MKTIVIAIVLCAIGYCVSGISLKQIAAHRARNIQRTSSGSLDAEFGESYCIDETNFLTSYRYTIPGRNTTFDLDFLGPSEDFCFQFDFPDTDPIENSTACLPESFFFLNLTVLNDADPTFNIVFRYFFNPASLQARDVDESSIRLLLLRDGEYGRFMNDAQVNTNSSIITQGSSSLTDIRNDESNIIGVFAGEGDCPPPFDNKCGRDLELCGEQCYSTDEYTCFDGFLCPKGLQRCGGACYSPDEYKCECGLSPV